MRSVSLFSLKSRQSEDNSSNLHHQHKILMILGGGGTERRGREVGKQYVAIP